MTLLAPPGTVGFCYVKIPAELFDSILNIMIDEDEYVLREPSKVGDSSFLHLIYDHQNDSVRIGIIGATAPSGFAYAHDSLVLVIVAALALLFVILSLLFKLLGFGFLILV